MDGGKAGAMIALQNPSSASLQYATICRPMCFRKTSAYLMIGFSSVNKSCPIAALKVGVKKSGLTSIFESGMTSYQLVKKENTHEDDGSGSAIAAGPVC